MKFRLKNRKTNLKEERGVTLVEFAIIAPLFFGLTLGLVDVIWLMGQRIVVTYAAQTGAREASQFRTDVGDDPDFTTDGLCHDHSENTAGVIPKLARDNANQVLSTFRMLPHTSVLAQVKRVDELFDKQPKGILGALCGKDADGKGGIWEDCIFRSAMRFVTVTISKPAECFFCQMISKQWNLQAQSTILVENEWSCEWDPYPYINGIPSTDLRI